METDCDFHLVGLHVTGNQSKIERPATPYWARLAQHIIKGMPVSHYTASSIQFNLTFALG